MTLYSPYSLYTLLKQGTRENSKRQKGKMEKIGTLFCDPIPLGNQIARARTHARTARHDTKRFPGWTHPQPPILSRNICWILLTVPTLS